MLHRLRIRPLVHAVERLAMAARQERTDMLVREDHQFLDEHVRMRLAFEPCVGDAAVAVEAKDLLRGLHLQCPAREAAIAQGRGELVVQRQLLEHLGRRLAALRLAVRETRVRADHRAIELSLAARRDLDGDAEPVEVRAQRAEVVGELVRQHRRDDPGDVGRERTLRGAVVERRARTDEERDVRDVHPRPDPTVLAPKRQRVVEVLRGVRVDRVGRQIAQVNPARGVGLGWIVRLEGAAGAALDEKRLEDVLDLIGRAEDLLDVRAPATGAHHGEVAARDVPDAFRLEHHRNARREVRLADDQLPFAFHLDDDALLGHGRSLR